MLGCVCEFTFRPVKLLLDPVEPEPSLLQRALDLLELELV